MKTPSDKPLSSEADPAGRTNPLQKVLSWSRRHPLLVTAILLLLFLLVYGWWQQAQYLAWRDAHPGHVRAPGARAVQAKGNPIGGLILLLVLFAWIDQMRWTNPHYPANKTSEIDRLRAVLQPESAGRTLPPWRMAVLTAIGALGLMATLHWSVCMIGAIIWEGHPVSDFLFIGCMGFYCSFELLRSVWNNRGAGIPGTPSSTESTPLPPPMPEDKLLQIRDAIFARRGAVAIQLYRDCTGAELAAAQARIQALARVLQFTDTEKFEPRRTFDPTRFAMIAIGVAAAVSAGVNFVPADLWRPMSPVVAVAFSLMFTIPTGVVILLLWLLLHLLYRINRTRSPLAWPLVNVLVGAVLSMLLLLIAVIPIGAWFMLLVAVNPKLTVVQAAMLMGSGAAIPLVALVGAYKRVSPAASAKQTYSPSSP